MSSVVVVTKNNTDGDEETSYVQLLEKTPVAEVEGESLSPDGKYEVIAVGASENYVSGVRLPEFLRIVDTASGEVLWEDMGYLWQSALWSPDSKYLALAYAGRTWNQVMIFETETWSNWQFTLPDGSPIPEYTFLPHEDWGQWQDENVLRISVGWGGDEEGQKGYFCTFDVTEGCLVGITEAAEKSLPDSYDFDHDGIEESITLEGNTNVLENSSFFGLRVLEKGEEQWHGIAGTSHAGWNNLFAVKLNGEDYLLRYNPYMGQGAAGYNYQIFSLNEAGEEVLLNENYVSFDINFGSPVHESFDAAAIAAFLEEVHGYLDESTLLLSTEGGVFRTGGSGAEFREDFRFWGESCPYDENKTLEENLRAYEMFTKAERGAA